MFAAGGSFYISAGNISIYTSLQAAIDKTDVGAVKAWIEDLGERIDTAELALYIKIAQDKYNAIEKQRDRVRFIHHLMAIRETKDPKLAESIDDTTTVIHAFMIYDKLLKRLNIKLTNARDILTMLQDLSNTKQRV